MIYTIVKQMEVYIMNFYGIRELSNNTKSVLSSVTPENLVVITDNGKPTALMIKISEDTFEEVLLLWKQVESMRTNQRENKKYGS